MNLEPETSSIANAERVHAVWDYYDGPREGIADFQGKPHVFKCQFSETEDDWTDLFWLMEISPRLLQLAKEKYAIFGHWKAEFELGNAPSDSHPALRADRVRYDELGATIGDGLQLRPERSITRRGRFLNRSSFDGAVVQWAMP